MSVITISREFGSEGDSIAERVAQTLGYHFVDKEFVGTVLSQYGLVEFDREYETLPSFREKFNAQREKRRDVMVDMLNQVVRAVKAFPASPETGKPTTRSIEVDPILATAVSDGLRCTMAHR